jgi:type I restriction enzyme, S subunit
MTNGWQEVLLGDVLTERKETPSPESLENGEVSIVSKIGFNEGKIELRADGKTKTGMILACPGDLVISGINATKGAIAVYPETARKPIAATIHYGAYMPIKERVDVQYLWWFLRSETFRDIVQHHIPGGIKTELKSKRFLAVPIPLPSLNEQQRILKRIEKLAASVNEAQHLRDEASEEANSLERSLIDKAYKSCVERYGTIELANACDSITDGDHITPKFEEKGVKFIFVGNVSSGFLHFRNCKYVLPEYFAKVRPQRKAQLGDVLYSAVGATLGVPAIVDQQEDFCFQRHIAIIKPNREKLDSRFLWYVLRSATIFDFAWTNTTGSAQPTVPLNAIRKFPVVVPPLDEQRRIVAYLDGLQEKVNTLRELQSASGEELSALMPSVLDKAFKGEL